MNDPRLKDTFLMVSNYNADISWILDYTDNYIIYDRSDTDEWIKPFNPKKVIKVPNIGWDIYDKFTYIIDNYDHLPDTIILTKGNIFKYITKEEFDGACNNKSFTPLFTKHHATRFPISFYSKDGMYNEINNSWYLGVYPAKYFKTYNDFIWRYVKKLPKYVQFGPGSNYLVTKKDILQYPKSFYEQLKKYISYSDHPGEAQIMERILYYLWKGEFDLNLPWYYKVKNYAFVIIQNIYINLKKFMSKIIKKLVLRILIKIKHILINIQISIKTSISMYTSKIRQRSNFEIINYRKKIKIYDVFNFFNELELLELRLNILDPYVDYFVIIESTLTHSGLPKKLIYEENKYIFKRFERKIIHFIIDEPLKDFEDAKNRTLSVKQSLDKEIIKMALSSNKVPNNMPHFLRDFYEKECARKALIGLSDDDFCFISDLDEIWNPKTIIDFEKNNVFKLKQNVYSYYLNNRSSENWFGTTATKYRNIKNSCLNDIRDSSKTKHTFVKNGGWHFTYQGGIEKVLQKIESFSHQEINNDKIKLEAKNKIQKNTDLFGRKFKFWIDESDLPKYILENKEKYRKMFKTDEK